MRGFGIRKWPNKRELTKTKQTCHRNINNALVSLTCDLEISAVAESSIAPFSTNTPSPVIHVTQQITCNFHYSTGWLSSLSLWITKRCNHSNESYWGDVLLFKAMCDKYILKTGTELQRANNCEMHQNFKNTFRLGIKKVFRELHNSFRCISASFQVCSLHLTRG